MTRDEAAGITVRAPVSHRLLRRKVRLLVRVVMAYQVFRMVICEVIASYNPTGVLIRREGRMRRH